MLTTGADAPRVNCDIMQVTFGHFVKSLAIYFRVRYTCIVAITSRNTGTRYELVYSCYAHTESMIISLLIVINFIKYVLT